MVAVVVARQEVWSRRSPEFIYGKKNETWTALVKNNGLTKICPFLFKRTHEQKCSHLGISHKHCCHDSVTGEGKDNLER